MLNENIQSIRKSKGLSQEELAIKLNVVRQTVSKWERGLSVPDSEMLINISEILETPVSVLLGETSNETPTDNLKVISEKLEIINLQLARSKATKRKISHWLFIMLCALIVITAAVLISQNSSYLGWDFNDPETAVVGTFFHAFEWFFFRLAPIALVGTIVGIVLTSEKEDILLQRISAKKEKNMKNQPLKQDRKYFLVSGILLAGILLYMVVRIGFLYFSLQLESTNSLHQTIGQHSGLLMVMDELLMLSIILCGCTFYNVGKRYFQNGKILIGLLITSFTLMLIAWLLIVLKTGRLIYPINGLPTVTGDNLQTTLAEIYATWHLCDILLGLFMIFWSGLLSRPLWKYSGIAIGLMQMLCTYFGQSVKPIPLLMAIILSTIWLLKLGISSLSDLNDKVFPTTNGN